MKTLEVKTSSATYPVYIGDGIKRNIVDLMTSTGHSYTKLLIVTDTAVDAIYGDEMIRLLEQKWSVHKVVVPSGEQSKSFVEFEHIHTKAIQFQLDRSSCIIALGGGVIGDLAGFVAASYMRGVDFIQVPTTLLAHDSAVGGKTGINHPLGKNLIGAFHQPKAVIYDTSMLETLSQIELRSGFAEVIKHALISSEDFLSELMSIRSLAECSKSELAHMLYQGIQVKASIVQKDEREQGVRAFLNLGHTLGHAIEAEYGYGVITHGDAIAIGMQFALYVSEKKLGLSLNRMELKNWMKELGFPVQVTQNISTKTFVDRMIGDKKARGGTVQFVLLKQVGDAVLQSFTKDELHHWLEEWKREEGCL
ncbi:MULTISPECIES: 3-dehydroquinate synthase [unclassified Bacillus (in: firmicutes)]|uniref:3-dehydroquinate synthase n=1 Tax=unclassified Bacillus (in: firmicutes) TaxID=185979 RepID=UPI000D02B58E|nr:MULTISPECIES: 3-dehydroquinate synthase [unclassified Bacillus (in: firmicutes)]PRS83664.1 3-dehydroquinate synthase [Bacillus sp. CJCL2]PRS88410.1 3-dehydroquinate synthase [Bacillus sp. YBWC18]